MGRIWMIIIIIVVVAAGAYYLFVYNKTSIPSTNNNTTVTNTVETQYKNITERTIVLAQQNGSDELGSAVLTEKDGKVTVTLDMTGVPLDVPQPAHIHSGSCPYVGAIAYPLTDVVNGKSKTVLDTTFAKLDAKGSLAINVHKSQAESKVYVSCGNLGPSAYESTPSPSSSSSPTTTSSPSPTASPTPTPAASTM